jgi:hypothetical protein
MAWHRYNDCFEDHPNYHDFGHGFRDGYAAVARGGDGCCPSMPPRCYWSACYRGCDGQAAANAWFDGYARGAIAAEADGLSSSGRILVRHPACGANCQVQGPAMAAGAVSIPSPAGYPTDATYPIGPQTPPPPAPPSMSPSIPADEAYETYNEGGLYYE